MIILPKNGNFTLTLQPETLESQSKAQKIQIVAYSPIKTSAKYFHLAVGRRAR